MRRTWTPFVCGAAALLTLTACESGPSAEPAHNRGPDETALAEASQYVSAPATRPEPTSATTTRAVSYVDTAPLDAGALAWCERFRAAAGDNRLDAGRAVFDHVLSRRGSAVDDAPTLTRSDLIDLLGPPDSSDAGTLTYRLGERFGRTHVLQVEVADDRVRSSNLLVWF